MKEQNLRLSSQNQEYFNIHESMNEKYTKIYSKAVLVDYLKEEMEQHTTSIVKMKDQLRAEEIKSQ